jgi:hypothetical protein
VKFVKVNDDILVFQLSSGIKQLTRYDVNFNKILKLLPTTEDELLPLLKQPAFPDGKFLLYGDDSTLYAKQYKHDNTVVTHNLTNVELILKELPFIGVYASIKDIRKEFSEYFV